MEMNLCKVALFFTIAHCDLYMRNFNISMETYIDQPKMWKNYIRSYLNYLTQAFLSKSSIPWVLFMYLNSSSYFLTLSRKNVKVKFIASNISQASGTISLHSKWEQFWCQQWDRFYMWHFYLDNRLSVNITFNKLYFISGPNDCLTGYLSIITPPHKPNFDIAKGTHYRPNYRLKITLQNMQDYKENNGLLFCGYHSNTNIYPRGRFLALVIGLHRDVIYNVNASFSVMDKGLSTVYENKKRQIHSVLYQLTISGQFSIFTFTFQLKKIYYMILKCLKLAESLIVYDGPGIFSPIIRKESDTFTTSSFQCVVQILSLFHMVNVSYDQYIKYIPRKIKHIKSIRLSKVVRKEFSTDECITNPCIIAIDTDQKFHINATVLTFEYLGDDQESSSCRYGGLVSVEQFHSENKEGLALCEDNFIVSRSFYSTHSKLILVIYSHEGYSKIKATLILSKTKCEPQEMNHLAAISNLDLLWINQRTKLYIALNFLLQQMNNSSGLKLFTPDDITGKSHNSFYFSVSAGACVILLFSQDDASFYYADLMSPRKHLLQVSLATYPDTYPDKYIDKMTFNIRGTFQQTYYKMFKYIKGRQCMHWSKHYRHPCNAKIGKFYPDIHDIEYFVVENINNTDEFFYHKKISNYLHCPMTIQNPYRPSDDKHNIVEIVKKMFLTHTDTFMGLSDFKAVNQSSDGVVHFIIRAAITPSRHSLTFRLILRLFLITHSWLHIAVYHHIEENSNVQNDAQTELENEYISRIFYQKQKYKPNLGESNIYLLHLKLYNIKQSESKFVVQTFFKSLLSNAYLVKSNWKFTSYFVHSSRSRFISLSISTEEMEILLGQGNRRQVNLCKRYLDR